MIIRTYQPGRDFATAVALGGEMHAESPAYRDKPFSVERLQELDELLKTQPNLTGLLCENLGDVLGLFVGGVAQEFFSPALYAFDFVFYVREPYRGGSCAIRLLSNFLAWAEQRGATEARIGLTTGIHHERSARLFEKLGFSRAGLMFSRALG